MFLSLFSLLTQSHAADDSLENLIEEEQVQKEEWSEGDPAEELPLVFMPGDLDSVRLYTPATQFRQESLCSSLELDELVQLSRGDPNQSEIELNTDLQHVREAIEDSCLIRPGDALYAVGRGPQHSVRVNKFLVRKGQSRCSNDNPYSLWMKISPALEGDPIFYTTALSSSDGSNFYLAAEALPTRDVDDELGLKLKAKVPFINEFRIKVYGVNDPSLQDVIALKRQSTSPDDEDLPNEILLAVRDGRLIQVASEAVNSERGSGRLLFQGVFDYNQDGLLDLEVKGFRAGCPYILVAKGTTTGWTLIEIPDILP